MIALVVAFGRNLGRGPSPVHGPGSCRAGCPWLLRSLGACRGLGVTLIAYQPLASGALTGMYATGSRPRGLRRSSSGTSAALPVMPLRGAQIALHWLIEQGDVIPIPGAKNGRQAAANAEALRRVPTL